MYLSKNLKCHKNTSQQCSLLRWLVVSCWSWDGAWRKITSSLACLAVLLDALLSCVEVCLFKGVVCLWTNRMDSETKVNDYSRVTWRRLKNKSCQCKGVWWKDRAAAYGEEHCLQETVQRWWRERLEKAGVGSENVLGKGGGIVVVLRLALWLCL